MFQKATGCDPYPYQRRLAECGELPSVLEVPTGLGKTAASMLSWLWRRRFAPESARNSTPRRLVYCLPMRVLVEQTRECAVTWLHNLGILGGDASFEEEGGRKTLTRYDPWRGNGGADRVSVHLLMGGDVDRDWDMYPERDMILIGTQDMLLSRALNRGYAMSRYRWPVQFGLLNNDCLWVMDEVQLMGNGLATTAQMQAFRRMLGTSKKIRSMWMSATMNMDWLNTVDFSPEHDAPGKHGLEEEDRIQDELQPRFNALRPLYKAEFTASRDGKDEADLLIKHHKAGTRSLIIVNTVKRAQTVYSALKKKKPSADLVLLHSRFRPHDRKKALERLLADPGERGIIAVSTQVVEAGVDVSARLLVTDLAPWASLTQRFGRCNRKGEFNESRDALIFWIEPPSLNDPKKTAPYTVEELEYARKQLKNTTDATPSKLPPVVSKIRYTSVIRKKDLLDLFDTTPDLAGADIDISRFIRETDDNDVQVFWRDIPKEAPSRIEPGPLMEELCSVSIADLRAFKKESWWWDYLDDTWNPADRIYPGQVLMLRSEDGGYDPEMGWTGEKGRTDPVEAEDRPQLDANDRDLLSVTRHWQTLAAHSDRVIDEISKLLRILGLDDGISYDLQKAARWHDVGKAHWIFQNALPRPLPDDFKLWAKSAGGRLNYKRRHFRHELASALAMLLNGQGDLAAYLAASHHGKVRFSIRSLPDESWPEEENRRFARGIWDGEILPEADLGGGEVMPGTTLNLSYMELGDDPATGPSWLARMLSLRDDPALGPFRLAFLEALMRVSDWRASNQIPDKEVQA
ncbi:MAG: CRISPR-associated helicase Cas3' [Desulfomonilia bacterium]